MGYREKLMEEKKSFKKASPCANAVKDAVYDTLCVFAEQEPEFAQAIEQSEKTLQDCCEYCVKGCGKSISDLEVFKRAAQFYFSTAEVHFNMTIDLCGNNGHTPPPITQSKSSLSISLDDLLGDL